MFENCTALVFNCAVYGWESGGLLMSGTAQCVALPSGGWRVDFITDGCKLSQVCCTLHSSPRVIFVCGGAFDFSLTWPFAGAPVAGGIERD